MKPYSALFIMSLRDAFTQRSTIIGYIVVWCLRGIVLTGIYSVAFQARGGSLHGIDITTTMWSIGVYFIVLSLSVRHIAKEMAKEIRLGVVETKLNKPFNYLFASSAIQLGRGAPHFLFAGTFIILFSLVAVGVPHVSWSLVWIGQVITLFVGGLALSILFYGMIGLCAAWFQDVEPLYWVLDKSVMVFGGAYIPVALFPSTVRAIAEHTPFGSMMFVTSIFNPDFSQQWLRLFTTQSLWLALFFIATLCVYSRAMKHLSVNGG